jgi:hypothetical protein
MDRNGDSTDILSNKRGKAGLYVSVVLAIILLLTAAVVGAEAAMLGPRVNADLQFQFWSKAGLAAASGIAGLVILVLKQQNEVEKSVTEALIKLRIEPLLQQIQTSAKRTQSENDEWIKYNQEKIKDRDALYSKLNESVMAAQSAVSKFANDMSDNDLVNNMLATISARVEIGAVAHKLAIKGDKIKAKLPIDEYEGVLLDIIIDVRRPIRATKGDKPSERSKSAVIPSDEDYRRMMETYAQRIDTLHNQITEYLSGILTST